MNNDGTPEYTEQSQKVLAEVIKDADSTLVARVDPDDSREIKTPGFFRMRTEWTPSESPIISQLRQVAETIVIKNFPDAFEVIHAVYEAVRQPEINKQTGEILTDHHGFTRWKRRPDGGFVEDYSFLTTREREDLLFRITTNLFDWKQSAADLWGDAMFAKAMWEESMAIGFDSPTGRLTVEDRTQRGRLHSRDERYFAIFRTLVSRKADAVCFTMELLGQRLKDSLV